MSLLGWQERIAVSIFPKKLLSLWSHSIIIIPDRMSSARSEASKIARYNSQIPQSHYWYSKEQTYSEEKAGTTYYALRKADEKDQFFQPTPYTVKVLKEEYMADMEMWKKKGLNRGLALASKLMHAQVQRFEVFKQQKKEQEKDHVARDKYFVRKKSDMNVEEYLTQQYRFGGTLPESSLLKIICPVVDVMSYIHSFHIIHRNIKVKNIFLQISYGHIRDVVLGGYSLCLLEEHEDKEEALGTPETMSPESYTKSYCTKTDIWSLGAVIYQMITNKTLVSRKGKLEAKLSKHYEEEMRTRFEDGREVQIRMELTEYNSFFKRLIALMLQYKPKDRPQISYIKKQLQMHENKNLQQSHNPSSEDLKSIVDTYFEIKRKFPKVRKQEGNTCFQADHRILLNIVGLRVLAASVQALLEQNSMKKQFQDTDNKEDLQELLQTHLGHILEQVKTPEYEKLFKRYTDLRPKSWKRKVESISSSQELLEFGIPYLSKLYTSISQKVNASNEAWLQMEESTESANPNQLELEPDEQLLVDCALLVLYGNRLLRINKFPLDQKAYNMEARIIASRLDNLRDVVQHP